MQGNIASTYGELGQREKALSMERDVYSGRLKLQGEEHPATLLAANNYAASLGELQRFEEAKSLLSRLLPVARRFLGEGHLTTLRMRWIYAKSLYEDDSATLDDLREAVETHEDLERNARRALGGSNPMVVEIEQSLQQALAALRACETPEKLAQEAFRTARAKLAQERAELAQTLADSSAKPSQDA